jgi:hypothetical protein
MTTDTLEALREAREALGRIACRAYSEPWPDHFADSPPDWALDDYESASSCGYCGAWLTVVRPGKSQCDCCSDGQDLGALASQALSRIDAALAEGEGRKRPRPKLWPSNPKGPPPRTAFPAASTDHIGNSTTMVPTLGVEGVAKLIAVVDALGQELAPDQGERGSHAFGLAVRARAIIATMEKNYGKPDGR